jgi:hypothetical protein
MIMCVIIILKLIKMKTKNKYGNIPTTINNIRFASKLEARFYIHLRNISETYNLSLIIQKKLEIYSIHNKKYYYIADFYLEDKNGKAFFIDAKGFKIQSSMTKIRIASSKYLLNYYVGDNISRAIYSLRKEFSL